MRHRLLMLVVAGLLPAGVWAQEGGALRREEGVSGAVVAPVALPDGATSVYGYVGAPELGVGFRQGLEGFEVEGRARLNWFQVSGVLEAVGRRQVWQRGPAALAPTLGLGLVLNSGATYLDKRNDSGVLLRLTPGAVASYRLADTASLVGGVDVPMDVGVGYLGLGSRKVRRLQVLAGGGAELYVGNDLTLAAVGQLGVESFRTSRGGADTRLVGAVRLGLGLRLF